MACFVHFSGYWNRLRFDRVAVTCTLLRFINHGKKCTFRFFQVRCAHKSGDVINFVIVAWRISSRLKRYKNYKNRFGLAKVIVKNKMSRFYGSLCRCVLAWCEEWRRTSCCKCTTYMYARVNAALRFCDWRTNKRMCMPSNLYTSRVERFNLIIILIESFVTRTLQFIRTNCLTASHARSDELFAFCSYVDDTKLTSQVSSVLRINIALWVFKAVWN